MKKNLLLTMLILSYFASYSQNVGIGTTTPDNSAQLDIVSNSRGLLIPRMTTAERTAISSPAKGLMVYDTETNGFWFYNGSSWTNMNSVVNAWSLTGNAGTDPSVNFIGTTDAQPLTFKVNGNRVGHLDSEGNIFWGKGAGISFTDGKNSIGIGNGALSNLSAYEEGMQSIAIGDSALYNFNNLYGRNLAIGSHSLFNSTFAYQNTSVGHYALYSNTTGSDNTAFGFYSSFSNISGESNTAIGVFALTSNEIGSDNTALGRSSLFSNSKGSSNTAIGVRALYRNTEGSNLVAVGDSSLFNNNSPTYNTAVGSHSLYANISGRENAAFGFHSLYANIDGNFNTAAGLYSLNGNTNGNANSAFGHFSLYKNTTGSSNTVFGEAALSNNTTGSYNTSIGQNTLNTIISGTYNTAIGYNANVNYEGLYNATAVGAFARADFNNTLVLGSVQGVNGAAQNVSVGIGTTSPSNALCIQTDSRADGWVQLELKEKGDDYSRIKFSNTLATSYWHIAGYPNNTAASARMNFYLSSIGDILSLHGDGNAWLRGSLTQNSDVTLKTNILQLTNLLPSIVALNGYRYHWKDHKLDQSVQIGLLAQEVEKYFPELVKKDSDGVLGVNYIGMIPVLIEGMKEQQQQIESLKESIQKLENLLHNSNLTKN